MKRILIAVITFSLFSCTIGRIANTSLPYELVKDDETKVYKGTITRDLIENDTTFRWFNENMNYGQADSAAVEAFKNKAGMFKMVVFGGTWCHDTQNLLPVFYRLIDKSAYPNANITLIGVDRAKTAPNDLHKTYNIINVPTFIVLQDGKEVGRVVEYGKQGAIDKELGEIVAGMK
ncbi:MAG: thioredoxin family protein [Segetibacter sp.]|nr:thioredoxin family protein [Segetibacter sp.]